MVRSANVGQTLSKPSLEPIRMHLDRCCDNMDLRWTQSRVRDRFSDIYVCKSCKHIHKMESWLVPLRYPGATLCVNCSGEVHKQGDIIKCDRCGLSPLEDKALHDRLGAAHPSREYLQGALAAVEDGRWVMALKLASAEIRWGSDWMMGRTVRLQALEKLGLVGRALDEAWNWTKGGDVPEFLWGVLADLEASTGNIEGAINCLRRGLEMDPDNNGMWTDMAELLAHVGDFGAAVEAAAHGVGTDELEARCLPLMVDVAEHFYETGLFDEAFQTASLTGPLQQQRPELAWLRARLAAVQAREDEAVRWLEIVLQLDGNHAPARDALERLRPTPKKKKGWFW